MNIDKFKQHMKEDIYYTDAERAYILSTALNSNGDSLTSMIVMEELAELQKAVIDMATGDPENRFHLLEELADVSIGLEYLRLMYSTGSYVADENHIYRTKNCNALRVVGTLSTLQQAISKAVRKHDNYDYNLGHWMRATYIQIVHLKRHYKITEEELQKAMDIKLNREILRQDINLGGIA